MITYDDITEADYMYSLDEVYQEEVNHWWIPLDKELELMNEVSE